MFGKLFKSKSKAKLKDTPPAVNDSGASHQSSPKLVITRSDSDSESSDDNDPRRSKQQGADSSSEDDTDIPHTDLTSLPPRIVRHDAIPAPSNVSIRSARPPASIASTTTRGKSPRPPKSKPQHKQPSHAEQHAQSLERMKERHRREAEFAMGLAQEPPRGSVLERIYAPPPPIRDRNGYGSGPNSPSRMSMMSVGSHHSDYSAPIQKSYSATNLSQIGGAYGQSLDRGSGLSAHSAYEESLGRRSMSMQRTSFVQSPRSVRREHALSPLAKRGRSASALDNARPMSNYSNYGYTEMDDVPLGARFALQPGGEMIGGRFRS